MKVLAVALVGLGAFLVYVAANGSLGNVWGAINNQSAAEPSDGAASAGSTAAGAEPPAAV